MDDLDLDLDLDLVCSRDHFLFYLLKYVECSAGKLCCLLLMQDDLLQELEEVSQEDTSTTRLSEENVIQIIAKLQDTGLLEVDMPRYGTRHFPNAIECIKK